MCVSSKHLDFCEITKKNPKDLVNLAASCEGLTNRRTYLHIREELGNESVVEPVRILTMIPHQYSALCSWVFTVFEFVFLDYSSLEFEFKPSDIEPWVN